MLAPHNATTQVAGRGHHGARKESAPRCWLEIARCMVRWFDVRSGGSVHFPVIVPGREIDAEAMLTDSDGRELVLRLDRPVHDVDAAAMALAWMLEEELGR